MNLEKINRIWQRTGGILSILIIAIIIVRWQENTDLEILSLLFWLHLAILMLHEFEEFVYPGGFKEFFNTKTVFALSDPQENVPLNETIIFYINMGAWILFALAALLTNVAPWLGVMMVVFNIVNIVGHIGIFQIKNKGYNPGLITTLVLLTPFSVYVFWFTIDSGILTTFEYVISIIGGILLAMSLPILGIASKKKYLNKIEMQ